MSALRKMAPIRPAKDLADVPSRCANRIGNLLWRNAALMHGTHRAHITWRKHGIAVLLPTRVTASPATISDHVRSIRLSRVPTQVIQRAVLRIVICVTRLFSWRATTDESFKQHRVDAHSARAATFRKPYRWILAGRFQNSAATLFAGRVYAIDAPHAPQVADFVEPFVSGN